MPFLDNPKAFCAKKGEKRYIKFIRTYWAQKTILQIIEIRGKLDYQRPKTRIISINPLSAENNSEPLVRVLEKQVLHDRITRFSSSSFLLPFASTISSQHPQPSTEQENRQAEFQAAFQDRPEEVFARFLEMQQEIERLRNAAASTPNADTPPSQPAVTYADLSSLAAACRAGDCAYGCKTTRERLDEQPSSEIRILLNPRQDLLMERKTDRR